MAEYQEQIPKQGSIGQDSDVLSYLRHLPYHLYNTKQHTQLHELIDYSWMEMRREQYSGSYEGILNDIELALDSPLSEDNKWISLQIRYALMKCSIKSLASKVSPELYPLLVKYDFWGISEAVTNAVNIIEPELKCKALLYLADTPQITLKDKEILQREILNMAWKPTDRHLEWWVFKDLSSRLTKNLLVDAIQVAKQKSFENRYRSLSALLPFLEDKQRRVLLDEIISDAYKLSDVGRRLIILERVASYLDKEQLLYILNTIFSFELDEFERRNALLSVVGFLPPDLHDRVLSLIEEFENELYKIEILICLAEQKYFELSTLFSRFRIQSIPEYLYPPVIPEHLKNKEIEMALDIFSKLDPVDTDKKVNCLNVLGTSSLTLTEYHEIILQKVGGNGSIDGQIFEIFYPRFSIQERTRAIEKLLSVADKDYHDFLFSCFNVAAYLYHQDATKLLTKIYNLVGNDSINDKDQYTYKAMGALIFRIEDSSQVDWLNNTMPLFSTVGDQTAVEFAVNNFAKHSGETEVFTIKELIDMFGDEMVRMECESILQQIKRTHDNSSADWILLVQDLVNLIPLLGAPQLSEVIDSFAEYENVVGDFAHNYDAFLLSRSIEHLPIELYDKLISRVAKHGCYCYRSVMFDLVAYLPNHLLVKFLVLLSSLDSDEKREISYYNLSPYFTDEFLDWLIAKKSLSQFDEDSLAKMLEIHRKPTLDFEEAFKICSHLSDDVVDYLLLSWVPYLNDVQLEQSLASCFRVVFKQVHWGPYPELFPCIRLAPYLPLNLYLTMLDSVENQSQLRIVLLQTFFSRLETMDKDIVMSNWSKVLNILLGSERKNFLLEISTSASFIGKFSGIHTLQDINFHIREISTWWK